ncbi:MAG: type III-A CRISPR-associated RAMP protein Csm4 [Lachnospiraceae bacterium]|nr:type III-A CRISPR-associated RAMP protein Csm4 [Lachnospiraceae bacterium]
MKYKIYKFDFIAGVHFGKKSLEDAEFTISADTLFSAICQEAVKQSEKQLEEFVKKTMQGKILFSDLFPYIQDTYYIPKPVMKIQTEQEIGDSVIKKAYKKLTYLPFDKLNVYLSGKLNVKEEVNRFQKELGRKDVRVNAAVRTGAETLPYRIGVYYFKFNSGLYFIVGYENEDDIIDIENYLEALSLIGIGGKRKAGLGRFVLKKGKISEDFLKRLNSGSGKILMSLSVCLPKENEMEKALEQARYILVKKSGFISSEKYSCEQLKKDDMYLMQAGACFDCRFEGDIYNVGTDGTHPVYRYAKPIFMEVIS